MAATVDESIQKCSETMMNEKSKIIIDQNQSDNQLISKLSDDLLLEIFLKLPQGLSITRCRIVCKRWFSLISDPQFILRYNQYYYNIYLNKDFDSSELSFDISFTLYPSKLAKPINRLLIFTTYHYSKIISTAEDNVLNFLPWPYVVVTASYHNLVLISPFDSLKDYYICNLLTRQWLALPEFPKTTPNRYEYFGHRIDHVFTFHKQFSSLIVTPFPETIHSEYEFFGCRFECEHHDDDECVDITQNKYKIVLIYYTASPRTDVYHFTALMFCSEIGKWWRTPYALPAIGRRSPDGCFVSGIDVISMDGVLYSLDGLENYKGIIAWDPFSSIGQLGHLIPLPVGFNQMQPPYERKVCVGVVLGQLRLLQLMKINRDCFSLKVWELDYGDKSTPSTGTSWFLVHEIELESVQEIFAFAFHPNNGNVIFLVRDLDIYEYKINKDEFIIDEIGSDTFSEDGYRLFCQLEREVSSEVVKYFSAFTLVHPS